MGYDYEMIYRADHKNKVVDVLSRQIECGILNANSLPKSTLLNDIRQKCRQDDEMQHLIRKNERKTQAY